MYLELYKLSNHTTESDPVQKPSQLQVQTNTFMK